jgi:2'-5' RNA ligase
MDPSLRTFIAVELNPNHKQALCEAQNKLSSIGADVKWVAPENCHITLKFLGQTPERQIRPIAQLLDDTARQTSPFEIELGELGAFPSLDKPQVLWVGLNKGPLPLIELSKILEERLLTLGFLKEARAFTPHITIGRSKTDRRIKELSLALRSTPVVSTTESVRGLTLFQSVLSSQGPRYSVIHRAALQ